MTLAHIIDRVLKRFGRDTKEIRARLVEDLNFWIDQTVRRWDLWLADVDPSPSVISNFPISSESALEGLTREKGRWLSRGWLVTSNGTYLYPVAAPAISVHDNDTVRHAGWNFVEVSRINYVQRVHLDGTPGKELEVLPPPAFYRRTGYQNKGEPSAVTFGTEHGVSHLVFSPLPDNSYLYAVGFRLARLPRLNRMDSVNSMTLAYPEAVITAGLMTLATYFNEVQEKAIYAAELYGAAYVTGDSSDGAVPGGMVGAMIADTRKRRLTRDSQAKSYLSAGRALNRGGIYRRRRGPFGYYQQP